MAYKSRTDKWVAYILGFLGPRSTPVGMIMKLLATAIICVAGAWIVYITGGKAGIWWTLIALGIVWFLG